MLQNKMFRCIPLLCVFKVCSVIKMANKLCECTYFLTFINLQKEKRVIIMNQKKVTLRGELALLIVILINSMGVVLFSLVFPALTLGTWTYIFQGLLVLSLMILKKRFVPSYLFSFVAGFAFGKMVDIHEIWINTLPLTIPLRVFYFVASYLILCFGIALSNRCKLPVIPTDLFPRDLSEIIKKPYSKVKITFDVTCLFITACMTFLCLGHISGLGIGTVAAAFTMGKTIGVIGDAIDKKVEFVSVLSK